MSYYYYNQNKPFTPSGYEKKFDVNTKNTKQKVYKNMQEKVRATGYSGGSSYAYGSSKLSKTTTAGNDDFNLSDVASVHETPMQGGGEQFLPYQPSTGYSESTNKFLSKGKFESSTTPSKSLMTPDQFRKENPELFGGSSSKTKKDSVLKPQNKWLAYKKPEFKYNKSLNCYVSKLEPETGVVKDNLQASMKGGVSEQLSRLEAMMNSLAQQMGHSKKTLSFGEGSGCEGRQDMSPNDNKMVRYQSAKPMYPKIALNPYIEKSFAYTPNSSGNNGQSVQLYGGLFVFQIVQNWIARNVPETVENWWPWSDGSDEWNIQKYFKDNKFFDKHQFDSFSFSGIEFWEEFKAVPGKALLLTVLNCMFSNLEHLNVNGVDPVNFMRFIARVGMTYEDIPYHNEGHGCAVNAAVLSFARLWLWKPRRHSNTYFTLSNDDLLALIVSSAGHDAGHLGVDNYLAQYLLPRLKWVPPDAAEYIPTGQFENYHSTIVRRLFFRFYFFTSKVSVAARKRGFATMIHDSIYGTCSLAKDEYGAAIGAQVMQKQFVPYPQFLVDWQKVKKTRNLVKQKYLKQMLMEAGDVCCLIIRLYYKALYEVVCVLWELVAEFDFCTWRKGIDDSDFPAWEKIKKEVNFWRNDSIGQASLYYGLVMPNGLPLCINILGGAVLDHKLVGRTGPLTQSGFILHVVRPLFLNWLENYGPDTSLAHLIRTSYILNIMGWFNNTNSRNVVEKFCEDKLPAVCLPDGDSLATMKAAALALKDEYEEEFPEKPFDWSKPAVYWT